MLFGFFLCNSEDCKPSNVGNCFFRSAWAQLICRSVNCQQQTPIFSESEQTHGLALCYQELARTQSEPSLICQEQDKRSWELQELDQQEVQVPSTPTFTILCPSPSTWKRTTLNTQSGQALEEQTMERSLLPNQSCCTEPMEELKTVWHLGLLEIELPNALPTSTKAEITFISMWNVSINF